MYADIQRQYASFEQNRSNLLPKNSAADITCCEAGWRPLPSGWRRNVVTIQLFHHCWRCISTETPPSDTAMKWRLNASAWPYINPPRGSASYFLWRTAWFWTLICWNDTSVIIWSTRPPFPPTPPPNCTSCSLSCLSLSEHNGGSRRRTALNRLKIEFMAYKYSQLGCPFERWMNYCRQGMV